LAASATGGLSNLTVPVTAGVLVFVIRYSVLALVLIVQT
jgi:hypothetical protein